MCHPEIVGAYCENSLQQMKQKAVETFFSHPLFQRYDDDDSIDDETTIAILLFAIGASSTINSTNAQQALVDSFELTTEIGRCGSPTDIIFLKNGVLLAANKDGTLIASQPNQYVAWSQNV